MIKFYTASPLLRCCLWLLLLGISKLTFAQSPFYTNARSSEQVVSTEHLLLGSSGLRFKKINARTYSIFSKHDSNSARIKSNETQTSAHMIVSHDEHSVLKDAVHEKYLQHVSIPVSGVITDETNNPLPGVNVLVKGSTMGTTSDSEGKYSLDVPDENAVLAVSFIGYIPQEILVGNQTTINIKLMPDIQQLSEVVVVGYGTQMKKDLTGSVGSVSSKEIKDLGVSRVEQSLSGRVAGVQVKYADGTPGGAPQIRIRGVGSISAGVDPLYVVDGFPTDNIQTINPKDIESLDILKDASATAIYGSRGSNGVVIINTKRGSAGKTKIDFDANYGLQQILKRPEFLNVHQQAEYYYYQARNRNIDLGNDVSGDPTTWAIKPPKTALDVLSGVNTTNVDALDAVMRTASQQGYNLSVSGGTAELKYAVSGEYFDQDGIIRNSNFKRYSLRANFDAQLSKKVTLKVNLNPSMTINKNVIASGGGAGASTSIIGTATSAQPYFPLYNDDGSYFVYQSLDASTDLNNPMALVNEKKDDSRRNRLLVNVGVEYKIRDDLKFNVLLGATLDQTKGNSFTPKLPALLNAPATGTDFATSGYNWLTEYTLNYNKIFGKHTIGALAGYTIQEDVLEQNRITSINYPNNLVPYLSAVSGIISDGSSSRDEWSLVSQLARVNYSYDGKYLLTASIRRDGSSRFGANNKYGVFPSAAVAWRISDENFMSDIGFIDEAKLRVSYGKTGNNNIGNYASVSTVDYIKYTTGGAAVGGFTPSVIPNPDLTWETQQQINLGVDINLFESRVNLSADRFISRNTDLLLSVNIPTATGFSTSLQNLGEVKNDGWEFLLSTRNLVGAFKWSTDFNISAYKNKVVSLGPSGDDIIVNNNLTRIGLPIGMFYGYITDGIFKNAEELAAGPIYNKGLADDSRVGDIRFKDISGPNGEPDGIINSLDRTIMGSPYPDFYYGMTNQLSYKNFGLSFTLAGSEGSSIYSNAMVIYRLTRSRSRTLSTEQNYWKSEEDPGDGKTVRPDDVPRGGLRLPSTRYMDTGSFLRINNITLSYIIPDKISKKLKMTTLRVYANATNPFIFTKNHLFNPDVSNFREPLSPGVDNNNYPVPKSIIFGINISL